MTRVVLRFGDFSLSIADLAPSSAWLHAEYRDAAEAAEGETFRSSGDVDHICPKFAGLLCTERETPGSPGAVPFLGPCLEMS